MEEAKRRGGDAEVERKGKEFRLIDNRLMTGESNIARNYP
jgi:hypothetical protein